MDEEEGRNRDAKQLRTEDGDRSGRGGRERGPVDGGARGSSRGGADSSDADTAGHDRLPERFGDGFVDGSSLYVRKAIIGVIAVDQGDGCTQYTYFYSDGSKAIVYRCLIIVRA